MTTTPLGEQNFNLSDDELKTIARIHLHWASADMSMGLALQQMCGISMELAKSLVFPLNERAKLELLGRRPEKLSNQTFATALKELNYCYSNYKNGRNVYAHGTIWTGEDGSRRVISFRGSEENPDQLPLRFEQAKYAAISGGRLVFSLIEGAQPPPWPKRPPTQLAE